MADPMRIRAQASGDKATVRVLMSHEMESVKGAKAGDKISVTWKDNKGDTRTDEATVS